MAHFELARGSVFLVSKVLYGVKMWCKTAYYVLVAFVWDSATQIECW